jgi:hypothetical protein
MAKNFKELQEKMPREARLRSEASAEKMISEMGLAELRAAMDMTQESLTNARRFPSRRALFSTLPS